MIALAESDEPVQRILRYAEYSKSAGAQACEIVPEVAGFGSAAGSHRGRVEVQDDILAAQCGERDTTAVVAGKCKSGPLVLLRVVRMQEGSVLRGY